ncbi:hypothetical protein [Paenisporosarcina indica]|uniref:hypothetical protein n=1 Tax=Paenisporosarcina indica TaxID=650093 RepID=UPI00094F6B11|nr:hypothetical protein [Paenisporosarcina indica]
MGLKKKWTNETFDIELNMYLPEWKRIGEVVNGATTVAVLCHNGHTRKLSPSKIKNQNNKCVNCFNYSQRKKAYEEFTKQLIKERYIPMFHFSDYTKANQTYSVVCPNGSSWNVSRTHFSGNIQLRCRCNLCLNTTNPIKKIVIRKPTEAADELFSLGFEIHPDKWKGIHHDIEGTWVDCGHKEFRKPSKIIYRQGKCSQCRSQHLLEKLFMYQRELGFIIVNEEQLKNLKTKQTLDIICKHNHKHTTWINNLFKSDIEDYKKNKAFVCSVCKSDFSKGENNPFYVHGKSIENYEGRTDALYKRWFRGVKKTGSICAVCQINPIEVSHHLYGFNEYDNVRYNLQNGVPLCHSCHNRFHDSYLYGNNTLDQFESYLEQLPEYDTRELQLHLHSIKPMLLSLINEEKTVRKKIYSISKLGLLLREYPEIVRILIVQGKIKGAYQDLDNIWVISQDDAEDFLKSGGKIDELLNSCIVGKVFGNLTVTKVIGRRSEGKQIRLFVETMCKCGVITEKPHYALERNSILSCSRTCELHKREKIHPNKALIDKVAEWYLDEQYSTNDILKEFNISRTTLHNYRKLKGIPLR